MQLHSLRGTKDVRDNSPFTAKLGAADDSLPGSASHPVPAPEGWGGGGLSLLSPAGTDPSADCPNCLRDSSG